jgi:hypothetical protein
MARALVRVAPFGFALFMQVTWFRSIASSPDPMAALRRDWWVFYDTGRHVVEGRLDSIYPHRFDTGFLWLHPPYCINLTAPLGIMSERIAYASCYLVEGAAVVGALLAMRATVPATRLAYWTAAGVVLASMGFNTTLALGQISGVLTLVIAAMLGLWTRRAPIAAGLVGSLLFLKPNIAAFLAAAAVATAEWRMLLGMAIGLATLVATSLPLGLARWTEYASTTERYARFVRDVTPPLKQLTLYAFWRTIPGMSAPTAAVAWAVSIATLVALAGLAMYRSGAASTDDRARVVALATVLAIACNFYAYFYDGLLLTIPGIVWYVRPSTYRRPFHVAIGACIATAFVVGYVQVFLEDFSGVSWLGAVIALWAALETVDLLGRRAARAVAVVQRAAASAS